MEQEKKRIKEGNMMLLPPHPNSCQICATNHEAEMPHNQQSLYYQISFNMQHPGKWPTWADAMKHCAPEIKALWIKELENMGQSIGEIQI